MGHITAAFRASGLKYRYSDTGDILLAMGVENVSRGYGKATLDSGASVDAARTVFRIGSLMKGFTAAAAVQLAERGKLDLHRDVREFSPDIFHSALAQGLISC